jgi:hypothetical protein
MKEIYQRVDFSVDIGLNCECGRVVKAPSPSGSRQLLRQQGGHNSERKHQTLKGRGPKPGQQVCLEVEFGSHYYSEGTGMRQMWSRVSKQKNDSADPLGTLNLTLKHWSYK